MTAPIPGVGPQLALADDGTDPRGVLVFEYLPSDLRNAEDSTQAADRERWRVGVYRTAAALWGTNDPAELRRLGKLGDQLLKAAGAGWRAFARPATPAERALLAHLGHTLPDELVTIVEHRSPGVRNRRWPQLIEID